MSEIFKYITQIINAINLQISQNMDKINNIVSDIKKSFTEFVSSFESIPSSIKEFGSTIQDIENDAASFFDNIAKPMEDFTDEIKKFGSIFEEIPKTFENSLSKFKLNI